jgi:hypothetical protein
MSTPSSRTFSAVSQKTAERRKGLGVFSLAALCRGRVWGFAHPKGTIFCSITDEPPNFKKFVVRLWGKRRFKLIDRYRQVYYQEIIK